MLDTQLTVEDIAKKVTSAIADTMRLRGLSPVEPRRDARLSETLGLKSMDLAQLVLELEDSLDTDPFQDIPITSIRTVGDLTNAYLLALGLATTPEAADLSVALAEARERRARRRR